MRQQYAIDFRGIEAEGIGIVLDQIATALQQATVNDNAAVQGVQHMAGAGHLSVRTMKGQSHVLAFSF